MLDNDRCVIYCSARVDELYRFLTAWVHHLYGELDEKSIKERGYELIQNDTDWATKGGSPTKVSIVLNTRIFLLTKI